MGFNSPILHMKLKAILFIILFVLSVTTLILAIFGGDNRTLFSIGTVIAHIALVLFGYFYALNSQDTLIESLRKDILGKE